MKFRLYQEKHPLKIITEVDLLVFKNKNPKLSKMAKIIRLFILIFRQAKFLKHNESKTERELESI
jgi:hypothetical protein